MFFDLLPIHFFHFWLVIITNFCSISCVCVEGFLNHKSIRVIPKQCCHFFQSLKANLKNVEDQDEIH